MQVHHDISIQSPGFPECCCYHIGLFTSVFTWPSPGDQPAEGWRQAAAVEWRIRYHYVSSAPLQDCFFISWAWLTSIHGRKHYCSGKRGKSIIRSLFHLPMPLHNQLGRRIIWATSWSWQIPIRIQLAIDTITGLARDRPWWLPARNSAPVYNTTNWRKFLACAGEYFHWVPPIIQVIPHSDIATANKPLG